MTEVTKRASSTTKVEPSALVSISHEATITENQSLKAQLRIANRTDISTGLGNIQERNASLKEALNRLTNTSGCLTVVTIDMDGLKKVNDTEGHSAGNKLIMEFANTLRHAVKEKSQSEERRHNMCEAVDMDDILCRTGGDEFAIVLPNTNEVQAHQFVKRIKHLLSYKEIKISAGMANIHGPIDPTKVDKIADNLIDIADQEMYKEKNSKKLRKFLTQFALRVEPVATVIAFTSGEILKELHHAKSARDAFIVAGTTLAAGLGNAYVEIRKFKRKELDLRI